VEGEDLAVLDVRRGNLLLFVAGFSHFYSKRVLTC
jgi:hypothetical protein